MKRYLNSFFITLLLYLGLAYALFTMFANEKITIKKSEPLKIISLNHIQLKKEIVEVSKPKKVEPKKIEKKEISKPKEIEPEKIVKKVEPKKIKPKKIVKKIPKKKKVLKKKIVKKKVTKPKKMVEKIVEKKAKKSVEKIVKQTTTIEKKTIPTVVIPAKKVDVKKDYLDKHLAQIRKYIIQNVKYPKRAKRMHIQDVVKVRFTLLSNGKVNNIQILSGNKHLHKSAINAVQKASSSFPKVSKDIDITFPIIYKLI